VGSAEVGTGGPVARPARLLHRDALPPIDLPLRPGREPGLGGGGASPLAPPRLPDAGRDLLAEAELAAATGPPLEDRDGRGLREFVTRATELQRGRLARPLRILYYGDSHVAADLYTDDLRRLLQRKLGDGGLGYLLAGCPASGTRHGGVEAGADEAWRCERARLGVSPAGSQQVGLGGFLARASLPGARAWLQLLPGEEGRAPLGSLELLALVQPEGGTLHLEIDGHPGRRLATAGSPGPSSRVASLRAELPPGHPQLALIAQGDGEVGLLGVVAESGEPGVVLDTLGINGAQAATLLLWDPALWAELLRRRDPDLVVLAYGTNEAGDWTASLAQYRLTLAQLLRQLRAIVPRASCLLVAPGDRAAPDRRGGYRTLPRILELVQAQRRVAAEQGCAFYSTFEAMGGSGAIDRWSRLQPPLAQPDRVHLSREGYRRLATMLGGALLRQLPP
jgi:lysophospholipase L1-like esterase